MKFPKGKQHLWSSLPASERAQVAALFLMLCPRVWATGSGWRQDQFWGSVGPYPSVAVSVRFKGFSGEAVCSSAVCVFMAEGLQQGVCIHKRCCSARVLLGAAVVGFWSTSVSTRRELQTLTVFSPSHLDKQTPTKRT